MVNIEDTIDKPATSSQCPTSKLTLYDYYFDKEKKYWVAWEWIIPNYIHNRTINFSEILVPTVDTLRIENILTLMNSVIYLKFISNNFNLNFITFIFKD